MAQRRGFPSNTLFVSIVTIVTGSMLAASEASTAHSQGPPRDGPAQRLALAIRTAAIMGVVVGAASRRPLRNVGISLGGGEPRTSRSAVSDSQGRFSFTALPAGRYTLTTSKRGYLDTTFGQPQGGQGRPGTPIQLENGQRFEARLAMARGGVLTGTLLDEDGEASPNVAVRALRFTRQSGRPKLLPAGNDTTDDRGVYRIYGLPPGEYVVGATPSNKDNLAALAKLRADLDSIRASRMNDLQGGGAADRANPQHAQTSAEEEPTGYAPVYYPGTTAVASGTVLRLRPSEERAGVDFQLQVVPIARVEGSVSSSAGPAQNINVSLVQTADATLGLGGLSASVEPSGSFRVMHVPPGQYTVIARGALALGAVRETREKELIAAARARGEPVFRPEPVRLWGLAEVSVDGRTVTNVAISLQRGMTVSGRVAFQGTSLQPPTDLTRLRVNIIPADVTSATNELASQVSGLVDTSGRFTISGVPPGRYRLIASAPVGWSLGSAVIDKLDTLDFPEELKPHQNVTQSVITFIDKPTELTGAIVNQQGQPEPGSTIIVYSADRRYWTPSSRRVMATRPSTNGQYSFRNLVPGVYHIAPVIDPEPGSWFDSKFLEQLEAGARRVSIVEGEKTLQNLQMATGQR